MRTCLIVDGTLKPFQYFPSDVSLNSLDGYCLGRSLEYSAAFGSMMAADSGQSRAMGYLVFKYIYGNVYFRVSSLYFLRLLVKILARRSIPR